MLKILDFNFLIRLGVRHLKIAEKIRPCFPNLMWKQSNTRNINMIRIRKETKVVTKFVKFD